MSFAVLARRPPGIKKLRRQAIIEISVMPGSLYWARVWLYFAPLCEAAALRARSHIRASRKQAGAHCIGGSASKRQTCLALLAQAVATFQKKERVSLEGALKGCSPAETMLSACFFLFHCRSRESQRRLFE
ncbi:hypothetical protein A3N37_10575 [Enterobacter ludwigii]|nr:hypothetical protein A3N37_10575 [Enterobacter ludwigii]